MSAAEDRRLAALAAAAKQRAADAAKVKSAAPVVVKPVPAPIVSRPVPPQQAAIARLTGSADTLERQAVAKSQGITQGQAAQQINKQVQANLAMQGSKNSAGALAGGSADRREAVNIGAAYGVSQGQGQKIGNTQVDILRAAQGLPPVFKPSEKVSNIPNPQVASSAKGSLAAGYQSTGPVSSKTGNPVIPGLPDMDASQDLRPQISGGGGGGGNVVKVPEVPFFEEEFSPKQTDRSLLKADQDALVTMSKKSTGPMNLLEPISGLERKVTKANSPGRTIRNLPFVLSTNPFRKRNYFGRVM